MSKRLTWICIAGLVLPACRSQIDLLPLSDTQPDSGTDRDLDSHIDTGVDVGDASSDAQHSDVGGDPIDPDGATDVPLEPGSEVVVSLCVSEMITCANEQASCVDVSGGTDCYCRPGWIGNGETCDSAGAATFETFIRSEVPDMGDAFGISVALSQDGNTLVVGVPQEDSLTSDQDNDAPNSGAVYVYVREPEGWAFQAYLKAPNPGTGDRFGNAVAVYDNVLAVGAPREDSSSMGVNGVFDNMLADSGAVYLYERQANQWQFRAFVKAPNPDADDQFGYSVSLGNNTLAVGAPYEDGDGDGVNPVVDNTSRDSGAAYVFQLTSGQWTSLATLKSPHSTVEDEFGLRVSLSASGATLAVSAPEDDRALPSSPIFARVENSGAVFVYDDLGGVWTHTASIKSDGLGAFDSFGRGLALSADGETLAIGSPFEDSDGPANNELGNNTGAVNIYQRVNNIWTFMQMLKAPHSENGGLFGAPLALSADGDILAVGDGLEDSLAFGINPMGNRSALHSGAIFVYRRTNSSWAATHFIKAPNTDAGDFLGNSVAISGDGSRVAAGATGEDSSGAGVGGEQNENLTDSGAVYVWTF